MKTIPRELIPEDFLYYRSSSRVFYEYYKNHTFLKVKKLEENSFKFLIENFLFLWIKNISIEKIDIEITKKKLKELKI
jgi:hypothetical protein